jgi:hypothetical protein
MVKVHCPRGIFSRCPDTAFVGIALAENECKEDRGINCRSSSDDERRRDGRSGRDDADPTDAFIDSARAMALALCQIQREYVDMFYPDMQPDKAADDRDETMRLYGHEVTAAAQRASRRHA